MFKNQRIINGTDATASDYPWFCSLSVGCGGSLCSIVQNDDKTYTGYIITAAHCFYNLKGLIDTDGTFTNLYHNKAIFGLEKFQDRTHKDNAKMSEYLITKVHIHPDYDPITIANDFAIIEIYMPTIHFDINNTHLPTIATSGQINDIQNATIVNIIGYGYTQTPIVAISGGEFTECLQKGTCEIVPNSFYDSHYSYFEDDMNHKKNIYVGPISSDNNGDTSGNNGDTSGNNGDTSGNKDPAKSAPGDSGGPVFIKTKDKKTIIYGVCSFGQLLQTNKGPEVSNPSMPSVYHCVSPYFDVFTNLTESKNTSPDWTDELPIAVMPDLKNEYKYYTDNVTVVFKLIIFLIRTIGFLTKQFEYCMQYSNVFVLLNSTILYIYENYTKSNYIKNINNYTVVFNNVLMILSSFVSLLLLFIEQIDKNKYKDFSKIIKKSRFNIFMPVIASFIQLTIYHFYNSIIYFSFWNQFTTVSYGVIIGINLILRLLGSQNKTSILKNIFNIRSLFTINSLITTKCACDC